MNTRRAVSLLVVLALIAPVPLASAEAMPEECSNDYVMRNNGGLDGSSSVPNFTDGCYHIKVEVNEVDGHDIDVIIVPPVGPLAERDVRLLHQGVQMWEKGINALAPSMGMAWLSEGLDFNIFIDGVDDIPLHVLADPEIVVVTTSALVGAYAGIGINAIEPGMFCSGIPNPIPHMSQFEATDGWESHHDGSGRLSRDCGGDQENIGGRVCVVANNGQTGTGIGAAISLFDLNTHEVGHCLGMGHSGDALDFKADTFPRDDIMSYEHDGWDPSYTLCVSNLDVHAMALNYDKWLGQPDQHGNSGQPVAGQGYFHLMRPADYRVASPTGLPEDCPQPSMALTPDPFAEYPDYEVPEGQPAVEITSPDGTTPVAAGTITVTGTVDRMADFNGLTGSIQAADGTNVGVSTTIRGSAFGGDAEQGYTCAWRDESGTAAYGDAGPSTGACDTTVTFADEGSFIVTLTVDDGNNTAVATHNMDVAAAQGVPTPDGTIVGSVNIFPAVAVLAYQELATTATGPVDPAPKFLPEEDVNLYARFVKDANGVHGPDGAAANWHIWNAAGELLETVPCATEDDSSTGETAPDPNDFNCPASYTMPAEVGRYFTTIQFDDGRWLCHEKEQVVDPIVPSTIPACIKAFDVGAEVPAAPTSGSAVAQVLDGSVLATSLPADSPCQLIVLDDADDDATTGGRREIEWLAAGDDDDNLYFCFGIADFDDAPSTAPAPDDKSTRYSVSWAADYEGPAISYSVRTVYNEAGEQTSTSALKGYAGTSAGLFADGVSVSAARDGNVVTFTIARATIGAPGDADDIEDISFSSGDDGSGNGIQDDQGSGGAYIMGSGPDRFEVDAGGPYNGVIDADIALNGAQVVSGGTAPFTYDWDLDNDGSYEVTDTAAPTFRSSSTGTFTVGLRVTDDDQSTTTDQATINVVEPGQSERVEFSVSGTDLGSAVVLTDTANPTGGWTGDVDLSAYGGQAITLTATWIDADDSVLAATSQVLSVQANDVDGTLTVTSHGDEDTVAAGAVTFTGTAARPQELAPLAADIAESSKSGIEDESLRFTSSVTGGDGSYTCTWTAATGTPTISNDDCTGANVAFADAGTHTVRLSVTDGSGGSAQDEANAVVSAVQALAVQAGGPYTTMEDQSATLTATASGGAGGYTCVWSQDSGPGTADFGTNGCTTTFTVDTAGTYGVTVVVTDADTDTASATAQVTVSQNLQPTVTIQSPTDGATGLQSPVAFSGLVDDPTSGTQQAAPRFDLSGIPADVLASMDATWEPWMAAIAPTIESTQGFRFGVPQVLDAERVLTLAYEGDAPNGLGALVPESWTLNLLEGVRSQPLRHDFDLPVPMDSAAANSQQGSPFNTFIGPGAQIMMSFDGTENALSLCTANWVWKDQDGNLYLGAAGHCFLPTGGVATHGVGADFDADLVRTWVCTELCPFGGQTGAVDQIFELAGNWVELGGIAYARQETPGVGDVGHDFGLIEIPAALHDKVSSEMPFWGTTDTVMEPVDGDHFFVHGNAAEYGETFATKSRTGIYWNQLFGLQATDSGAWNALVPSYGGDSGSAVGGLPNGDHGRLDSGVDAVGILTHGYSLGDCNTPACLIGVGVSLNIAEGTLIDRAMEMAKEAGLCIEPLLGSDDPEAAGVAADCGLNSGSVSYSIDGGALTPGGAYDGTTGAWTFDVPMLPGTQDVTVHLMDDGTSVATDTITVTIDAPSGDELASGQPVRVTQNEGETARYSVTVPEGATDLLVTMTEETAGDWDLGVKYNEAPGFSDPDYFLSQADDNHCYPYSTADTEQCAIAAPAAGTWHIGVNAYQGTGDAVLMASWTEAGGDQRAWILPLGAQQAAFGPTSGQTGERVELYRNGTFVVSDAVSTESDPFADSWSTAITLAEGRHNLTWEWYTAQDVLVNRTSINVTAEGPNQAPTANAGTDQSVNEATSVTLDATGSSDADGTIASYAWAQDSGTTVSLSDASAAQPTFTAPDVDTNGETLQFTVTVTDNEGATATDSVQVTVNDVAAPNNAPVLGAIGDATVQAGNDLNLSVSASDADSDALSFALASNASIALDDAGDGNAWLNWTTTEADEGTYWANVTVTDGNGGSDWENLTITVSACTEACSEVQQVAPTVTAFSVDAGPFVNDEANTVSVTGTVHDANGESDIASVTARWKAAGDAGWTDVSFTPTDGTADDGALEVAFTISLPAQADPDTYTVELHVADSATNADSDSATFDVVEPLAIGYSGNAGHWDFGAMTPGATNHVSENRLTVANEQGQTVTVLFEMEDFTQTSGSGVVPVRGNAHLVIDDGDGVYEPEGDDTIIQYDDAVITLDAALADGERIEAWMVIEAIPEPLPSGSYRSSFGVFE